jgi:uncharacterized protein involved in exopolysaccharide biosynthesis
MNNNIDDNDIDLSEVITYLWSKKLKIIIFTLTISTLSVLSTFYLPNYYKSSALLEVISSNPQMSSMRSSMNGLASIAGINVPGGESANRTSFIVETLKSRDFVENLITYEDVMPSIIAAESFDHSNGRISFDENLYNSKNKEWVRNASYPYSKIPSTQEVHKELNEKILVVSVDKRTGYITISIEHISPIFAKEFLDIIIDELNKVSREKDLKESQEALNFLKTEASKATLSPLNESISRLIESKLETQMMAQIHEDYLLRYIDSPFIPEKKSWPKRSNILVISVFVSFLSILFFFLLRFFYSRR